MAAALEMVIVSGSAKGTGEKGKSQIPQGTAIQGIAMCLCWC